MNCSKCLMRSLAWRRSWDSLDLVDVGQTQSTSERRHPAHTGCSPLHLTLRVLQGEQAKPYRRAFLAGVEAESVVLSFTAADDMMGGVLG